MGKCAIYTKTGDDGTTDLAGGVRVDKTHDRIEAYGTVDELNCQLGVLACFVKDEEAVMVRNLQSMLFKVGASLASAEGHTPGCDYTLPEDASDWLEREMDRMDEMIPPLTEFVLPGGCQAAAQAHVCRSVCRRAERRILFLSKHEPVDEKVRIFMNRLSDYLFVLSRFLNKINSSEEIFLQRSCK